MFSIQTDQDAFDLGQNLLVAEVGASDHTTWAGGYAGATPLAECRVHPRHRQIFDEVYGTVGAHIVADATTGAPFFINFSTHRLDLHLTLSDQAKNSGGRGRALGHAVGDIFRPLGTASDEDAVGHGGYWIKLGVLFDEPIVVAATNPKQVSDFGGIVSRLDGGAQDHHIHRHASLRPNKGVLGLNDQLALLAWSADSIRNLSHAAPDKVGTLLQQPVIELLVTFARGADVDVEVVDIAVRQSFVN